MSVDSKAKHGPMTAQDFATLSSAFPVVLEVFAGLLPGNDSRPAAVLRLSEQGNLLTPGDPAFVDALLIALEGVLWLAYQQASQEGAAKAAVLLMALHGRSAGEGLQ